MIKLKNKAQIAKLRESGAILAACFRHVEKFVQAGISTYELSLEAANFIKSKNAIPSFYQYNNYPGYICTSINNVIIHGIPSKNDILKNGDIVGLDIGVNLDGYFTDSAKTFAVGRIDQETQKLLRISEESLFKGLEAAVPGNRIKDIGKAITGHIKPHSYGIVDQFCGHGVGFAVHEDPHIFNNYPSSGPNIRLQPGMVLAIEPMICLGTHEVEVLDDGFTVLTLDGKNAAHFEHTVAVGDTSFEILTQA